MRLPWQSRNDDEAGVLEQARQVVEQTKNEGLEGRADSLVRALLEIGIDGRGPFASAATVADRALASSSSEEAAIGKVVRQTLAKGAAGGFVTGLGGFVTMPVALPVNVVEFHLLATRMIAAIAKIRGYDIADPQVRTAVLLALTGSNADEILTKAGVVVPGGRLAGLALSRLPRSAMMVINKAIGFRLAASLARSGLSRLGKALPAVGGAIGAGVDTFMMQRIASFARKEFPAVH